MNISHRSLWNAALGAWVAVSEITGACGKRSVGAVTLALACSSVGAQVAIDGGASETVPGTQGNLWNIGGRLTVGNFNTGTLTVSNGGMVSNTEGFLGFNSSGIGNATVTGAGSTWTNSDSLYVGQGGSGTLTVQNGGAVSNTGGMIGNIFGSTGNATVTGAGSNWTNSDTLQVGVLGTGTLSVQDGATVSNTVGVVGNGSGSAGNATVTGAGATWTNSSQLFIGYNSAGTLTVQDGGTVSNTSGFLGYLSGSTGNATVTGANATWTNSDTLEVGRSGTGTLIAQDGGTVSNTDGVLGSGAGSSGNATVTGANSTWANSGTLEVGRSGTGTLIVQDGGTINNSFGFIGNFAGAIGNATVTGAGATWTNSSSLSVGRSGTGTLTVANGGQVSVNNGTGIILVAQVTGSTGVLNIGAAAGSAAQAAGTVAAGELRFGGGIGSLNFNHTDAAYVFGTRITGAGVLNQVAGTTILTGANTYSGGTTISAGTLQIGNGGITGTLGTGTVTNNGSLNFNRSDTLTVANNILGTGNLAVAGGTVILSGNNSYVGATTVAGGGTLQIDNVSALGGTTTITNNGSLVFNAPGVTTVTGNVAGMGSLTQAGTGITVLNGASTYSGATNLSAGILMALNSAAFSQSSAFTVNAPATLNLNGFDESIGSLAGGGSVTAGGGRLTTGSDNSSTTFSGVISGTGGGVTKTGTGTFTLSGVNTYTGATTVNAGKLSVNGSTSNSAVTVNNGGTLGGSGTTGSTTIATGGVLAPGNSIGTLTVNGNLSFAAGSVYRVEVDAAGANDRINATGTATINGGTVDVQASAGAYAANTTYTILNAAGGRTGNFAGVTSNLAFLTPTLAYDANNVFLTLARNSTSFNAPVVAITPNQIATSTALQNAVIGASGDMSTVINAVTGLSAAQARAAYDSASGAGLVALRNAGAGFAAGFASQLQARLGVVQGGGNTQVGAFAGGPILLAANDRVSDLRPPVSDAAPQKFSLAGGRSSSSSSGSSLGRGFWLRGSGGQQNTDSDGNAAASKLRNGALSAGFDAEVGEGLVLGAALSSGTARLSFENNDAGKSRGSAVALYGSYAAGPWAFKGSANAAKSSNHMDRAVTVGGLNRLASSDFDSTTLSAYGEATYSLSMNGWTLQPLAALSVSRSKIDGFAETGAGALNLQVAGQTMTSTRSLLGAKASFDAGSVRLEPRAIWAHEFGDINMPMTAQFEGAATASPFQVSGVALKRDTLILGLGASGSISRGADLFADVQLEHNQRQRKLSALIGVRVRW